MRADPHAFEARYRAAADHDPWRFATSPYEQHRYEVTVQALGERRFTRAFEPGCATGELTARLAARCATVVALDPSPTALAVAARRTAGLPGVELRHGTLPEDWPAGTFDLVVLSEIGYYFDRAGLRSLVERVMTAAAPRACVLGVHWTGHSDDHVLHGDTVQDIIGAVLGTPPALRDDHPGFRCARWDLP